MNSKIGDKVLVSRVIDGQDVVYEGTISMVIPRQDNTLVYRVIFDDGDAIISEEDIMSEDEIGEPILLEEIIEENEE